MTVAPEEMPWEGKVVRIPVLVMLANYVCNLPSIDGEIKSTRDEVGTG